MYHPLTIHFGTQTVLVNQAGGALISYQTEGREIVYGYTEDTQAGSMGDVLFPFPGRVENSRYTFEDHEYELSDVSIKEGHAIHGFAKNALWKVEDQSESSVTLSFVMTEAEYAPKGFPFSLTLTLRYTLRDSGLQVEATVTNPGTKAAPFGLGFHPYYRVGTETVDDISLDLPATQRVEFDGLKPTGRMISEEEAPWNFHPIGAQVIDACFTGLEFSEGMASTQIRSAADAITVWQDQNFPYLQVYSSDTLPESHFRKGVAVEAQTCTGFAFNMPHMGLRTLQPGEQFRGSWGITP